MTAAFELMPRPDWAATTIVPVPPGVTQDSMIWARAIFDPRSAPALVKALFALREVAVRFMGIPPGDPSMLRVTGRCGPDAIIETDDEHLHFVAATRVENGCVQVLTAVTFKGRRGRLYFAPVRLLHDAVTRSMINGAARRLAA